MTSGRSAWFAPFDSEFAYALPAGPAPLDGSLFVEPPRARRGALDLAAVVPPAGARGRAELVLLGRDGRYAAVLLEGPDGARRPATYLSPEEDFAGRPRPRARRAARRGHPRARRARARRRPAPRRSAPIPSVGAGRGGDVVVLGDRIHVVGRDTLWVWERP